MVAFGVDVGGAELKSLMLMLYDPSRMDAVLDAWTAVGILEVAVVEAESVVRSPRGRCHARYIFGLGRAVGDIEEMGLLMLGLAPDDVSPEQFTAATEEALGSLDESNAGLLLAWDLAVVKGRPVCACPEGSS
jgi:hypothetical protein